MASKSVVQQNKEEVKQKQKQAKETEMKNLKENSTIKTVGIVLATMVVTLGAVYGAYRIYQMGHAAGVQFEKSYSAEVDRAVASKSQQ